MRRGNFPPDAGRRLPPGGADQGPAAAADGHHLGVWHGIHVGLGDQYLPGYQGRFAVIAPNSLEKTQKACKAFTLKRQLKELKFLVYQDQPASGGGNQDEIFKRFYWWEDECVEAIEKPLRAQDHQEGILRSWAKMPGRSPTPKCRGECRLPAKGSTPIAKITNRAVLSAIKTYMAVKRRPGDRTRPSWR